MQQFLEFNEGSFGASAKKAPFAVQNVGVKGRKIFFLKKLNGLKNQRKLTILQTQAL